MLCVLIWCLAWRSNPGFSSNTATHYLLATPLTADTAIFKNRVKNIECSFGCVARSAILLKSNVANILLFNSIQKFFQHGRITVAIDCNGLYLLIFEEKWLNYASGPKSAAPHCDSFFVRRRFNVCVLVFCAPIVTILLVYIRAKIKMSFIWKDDFFLLISASSVSLSQAYFPALFKRIHNYIPSAEG